MLARRKYFVSLYHYSTLKEQIRIPKKVHKTGFRRKVLRIRANEMHIGREINISRVCQPCNTQMDELVWMKQTVRRTTHTHNLLIDSPKKAEGKRRQWYKSKSTCVVLKIATRVIPDPSKQELQITSLCVAWIKVMSLSQRHFMPVYYHTTCLFSKAIFSKASLFKKNIRRQIGRFYFYIFLKIWSFFGNWFFVAKFVQRK